MTKPTKAIRQLTFGVSVTATTLFAPIALAQLEEVIVTATKRAESTQTLPISISAVTGEELKARGVVEFFDFAPSIPNLSFGAATDGVLSGRSISLRGIQGANTTGMYIDDTPITETIDPRILELERVEVLRGPQGTLYGARSLGGTIRQITRKPDLEEAYGNVRLGISSTDESDNLNSIVSGSYNLPMSDNSALLFSGLIENKAGFFDRAVGSIPDHVGAPATLAGAPDFVNEDVDSSDTIALQVAARFQPTDKLTIDPRVMYQKVELDGFPLADITPDNFVQNRDFDTFEGGEDEWSLYSLNVNYETERGTFTSATSYFDRETMETEGSGSFINFLQALPEADGGFGLFGVIPVTPVPSAIFQRLNFETTVQELRFASDLDGKYNFVVGGFYQKTDDNEAFDPPNYAVGLNDNFATLADTLMLGPVEGIWPFGDLVFTSFRPTEITELGLFGEFNYDLTDRWSVVAGIRYFDTEVEFSEQQAGLAAGVPLAVGTPVTTVPATSGNQQEDGINLKFSAEYEVNDAVFVYGSFAEGFRLGGANGTIPNALGCPDDLVDLGLGGLDTSSYNSDDLASYELGIKADISDRTRINATAFLIDFDGIQQTVQLECGFQFVGNFGAARSQGFELEYLTSPSDNLTVGVNLGYTDAEFTETVFGGAVNTDGDKLQFVPELTGSISVDYVKPAAYRQMDFFTRVDVSYVDESISRVNSIPRVRDAYEQVGLRLGLRNEKYSATLFVRNLTNEIANLADNRSLAAETPGRPRFVVSRPRTLGVEFNYDF